MDAIFKPLRQNYNRIWWCLNI